MTEIVFPMMEDSASGNILSSLVSWSQTSKPLKLRVFAIVEGTCDGRGWGTRGGNVVVGTEEGRGLVEDVVAPE